MELVVNFQKEDTNRVAVEELERKVLQEAVNIVTVDLEQQHQGTGFPSKIHY